MTVESFTPAERYTVQGVGPYAIPWSYYDAEEVTVRITTDGVVSYLTLNVEFTVSPTSDAESGAVTLTAAAAAQHDGAYLNIDRATVIEQGWKSAGGAREAGLEQQLDRIVRALQDEDGRRGLVSALAMRAVRAPDHEPALPEAPPVSQRSGKLFQWGALGEPSVYEGSLTPTIGADGLHTFETVVAIGLVNIPAAVGRIQTQGYAGAADRGGASYVRVASEPAHPGKVQSADGAWWEIADPELRVEQLGAVIADGVTDESAAIQAALNTAVATGRRLTVVRSHAIHLDVTITGPVHFYGGGPLNEIVCYAGAKVHGWMGATDETLVGARFRYLNFRDGGDQAAWVQTPMLETARIAGAEIYGCSFDGADRRRYGAWPGRGNTAFACDISHNEFVRCEIGVVVGELNDATHLRFHSNTCHHNKICGAILCNPTGATIHSNSFEHNEGPAGLAVLSFANGSGAKAANISIRGNYIFKNAINYGGVDGTAGLLLGFAPAGSGFTSGVVWDVTVEDNYIVSEYTMRAIRANLTQGARIIGNVTEAHASSDYEIELNGGIPELTVVSLNKKQSGDFDRVLALDGAGDPADYLRPVYMTTATVIWTAAEDLEWQYQGDTFARLGPAEVTLGADEFGRHQAGGIRQLRRNGAAETPGALLTAADFGANATGMILALVALEQTNGNDTSTLLIAYHGAGKLLGGGAVPAAFTILSRSPDPEPETLTDIFALSGGDVVLTRDQGWQANITIAFAMQPNS